jgi:Gpi18-like mannosyltransferase
MKICLSKREFLFLAALLFFSFVVRVIFFPHKGYINDLNAYEWWFNTAATAGFRPFYKVVEFVDYPPFNVYIFWLFGSIAKMFSLFGSNLIRYIIKLPPNIFDLATSTLIFIFVRKRSPLKIALIATAIYAFNPAVIFNAAIWGQFDAIYTFFLILSLFLILETRLELAVVAFTLGILSKPQSIAMAPLTIFLVLKEFNWRRLVTSIGVAIATVFAVILPLEWTSSNPVNFLSDVYFGAYGNYPYTSLNAFNIWAFGGMWKSDTTVFLFTNKNIFGWLIFGALVTLTLYIVYKRVSISEEMVILFSAFLLLFGFFMLPTRIHERYLFPIFSVMSILVPFIKKIRPIYAILSGTYLINLAYVLYYNYAALPIADGDPVVITVSLINLIVFLYVLVLTLGALKGSKRLSIIPESTEIDKRT